MRLARLLAAALGLAGAACFLACGGAGSPDTRTRAEKQLSGTRYVGMNAAKKVLADVLVAPDSAEYPWETVQSRQGAEIEGLPSYIVTGEVKASNRLGAELRKRWETIVVKKGGDLVPVCVAIDGETVWGEDDFRYEAAITRPSPPEKQPAKPAEEADDPEQLAAGKFRLAKQLLEVKPEKARERLQEIVERWPDTAAGREAAELLK